MRASLFLLPALLAAATPALAQQGSSADDNAYLVPYIGVFDALDDENNVQGGVEYRWAEIAYGLRPTVGLSVDSESAAYLYGGLNWDIALGSSFFFTPNFMVGAYTDGDDGKDLGGALEFRSGLELSYAFENESRLGVAFNHISNASIYDSNPGAETVLINYHLPVGWLTE